MKYINLLSHNEDDDIPILSFLHENEDNEAERADNSTANSSDVLLSYSSDNNRVLNFMFSK